MEEIRNRRVFLGAFLFILLNAALLAALTDLAKGLATGIYLGQNEFWISQVVFIFVFAVIFYFVLQITARKAGKVIGAEVTTARAERQPPLEYLLMGYSPRDASPTLEEILEELSVLGPAAVAGSGAIYDKALKDHNCMKISNRWQQNLRAAWHHHEKLKAIFVLDPDRDQFEDLRCYLKAALPHVDVIRISTTENPGAPFCTYDGGGRMILPSYENYNHVYEGLRRGTEMVRARVRQEPGASWAKGPKAWLWGTGIEDYADRLTCIDATAGQKVFSIAAAVLTLNRPLKFSYVTTRSDDDVASGEVRFYDAHLRLSGPSS